MVTSWPVDCLERFVKLVEVQPDGCWRWKGFVLKTGYGTFRVGSLRDGSRRKIYVHRFAYEAFVGPILDGMQIDHVCHSRDLSCPGGVICLHRRCANPQHLEPVTSKENVRRSKSIWGINARKTACLAGHPYDEINTRVTGGVRQCRACDRERQRLKRVAAWKELTVCSSIIA